MDRAELITLTADIVASHVSNNSVSIGDMPVLLQKVHEALAGLVEGGKEEEAERKTPVVSVRASVKPDYIICMECGKKQRTLKRHIMTAHGMTPDQYRKDYGLPDSYPMVASAYSERRRELARKIGLGRKPASASVEAEGGTPARGRGRKASAGSEAAAEDGGNGRKRGGGRRAAVEGD